MSKSNFSVTQCVRSRSESIRLRRFRSSGVSQYSLYEWKKEFAASNTKANDEAEEIGGGELKSEIS
ncbi:Hypothetical protein BROD_2897 [Brucella sp. NF 2653]|nr:Hypothetical protein BROD_2897 [Brucella sp. NF 2653]